MQLTRHPARRQDVESGGRYHTGAAALSCWTHSWTIPAERDKSPLRGTFLAAWGDDNRLWKLEVEDGWSQEDLLNVRTGRSSRGRRLPSDPLIVGPRRLQYLTHHADQRLRSEGFLEQREPRLPDAMLEQFIGGVAGDE